jgi:single-strand DNA-binding protein
VNRVVLIGKVSSELNVREYKEGHYAVRFTLITYQSRRTPDGQWVNETDWHTIKAYKPLDFMERMHEKLQVGCAVYVEGPIRYEKYTDKNGNPRKEAVIYAYKLQGYGRLARVPPEEQPQEQQEQVTEETS